MKIKVSDYIARTLVEHGLTQVFTVTGGGAMHLNDALGHEPGLHCLYEHHEQACAMAAESYGRLHDRPAVLCVTTGPGVPTPSPACWAAGWIPSLCWCCRDKCAMTRLPDGPVWEFGLWEIRSLTSERQWDA